MIHCCSQSSQTCILTKLITAGTLICQSIPPYPLHGDAMWSVTTMENRHLATYQSDIHYHGQGLQRSANLS